MKKKPVFPATVFYDGSCHVCSREAGIYRKKDVSVRLRFVDIAGPDFRPNDYGKSHGEFMARMHVLDARGIWFEGVDGFRAIWTAFPEDKAYAALAWVVALPVVRRLAKLGYGCFAGIRRRLPRRGTGCKAGGCGITHG